MKTTILEALYQEYEALGQTFLKEEVSFEMAWKRLTQNGIWRIPLSDQEGGLGFSWVEWLSALQQLIISYHDINFCEALMQHAVVFYTLMRLSDPSQKKQYLPLLIKGIRVSLDEILKTSVIPKETELFAETVQGVLFAQTTPTTLKNDRCLQDAKAQQACQKLENQCHGLAHCLEGFFKYWIEYSADQDFHFISSNPTHKKILQ